MPPIFLVSSALNFSWWISGKMEPTGHPPFFRLRSGGIDFFRSSPVPWYLGWWIPWWRRRSIDSSTFGVGQWRFEDWNGFVCDTVCRATLRWWENVWHQHRNRCPAESSTMFLHVLCIIYVSYLQTFHALAVFSCCQLIYSFWLH